MLLGKIISLPKLVRARGIDIITFDFMSNARKYYKVVFFNQPYLAKSLKIDEEYSIIGTFNLKRNEVDGQKIIKGEVPSEERLKPVYSLPAGFQNYLYAALVKKCLGTVKGQIFSTIPYDYLNKYRLINKEIALNWAHNPKKPEEIHQALRHLKYEEALLFSLKNQLIRESNKSLSKIKKEPIGVDICEPFISALPYKLTEDQLTACQEIIEDMNQNSLMYRLLQGDVGTGKTLVSFVALFANHLRGDQGALMAPTDALARQHYANALKLFKNTKIKIALLLGSTPLSEKKQIKDDLKEGYIDIIIGTHALFTKDTIYSSPTAFPGDPASAASTASWRNESNCLQRTAFPSMPHTSRLTPTRASGTTRAFRTWSASPTAVRSAHTTAGRSGSGESSRKQKQYPNSRKSLTRHSRQAGHSGSSAIPRRK